MTSTPDPQAEIPSPAPGGLPLRRRNPWWLPPFLGRVPAIEDRYFRILGTVALGLFLESDDLSLLTSALEHISEDLGMAEHELGFYLGALAAFGHGLGALLFAAIDVVPFGWRAPAAIRAARRWSAGPASSTRSAPSRLSTELFPTSQRGASAAWLTLLQTIGWILGRWIVGVGRWAGVSLPMMISAVSATVFEAGILLLRLPETRQRDLEELSDEGRR